VVCSSVKRICEVYVERHRVDQRRSDRPIHEREQTIDVPVREERVDVDKQPVVYEEVTVGKRQVADTRPVSATIRREEARVGNEGHVDVSGTESSDRRLPLARLHCYPPGALRRA